jgi:hypothetical protein
MPIFSPCFLKKRVDEITMLYISAFFISALKIVIDCNETWYVYYPIALSYCLISYNHKCHGKHAKSWGWNDTGTLILGTELRMVICLVKICNFGSGNNMVARWILSLAFSLIITISEPLEFGILKIWWEYQLDIHQ